MLKTSQTKSAKNLSLSVNIAKNVKISSGDSNNNEPVKKSLPYKRSTIKTTAYLTLDTKIAFI